MSGPELVLVGPPGAGKTTVGRLVAARRGVGFRDTDADVEATVGKTIAEIFFDEGEPAFRSLEAAAVARALQEHTGVLSLGGGAVLDADTRALLQAPFVVFLNVGLAAAAKRVGLSRDRPVLALNPRATLSALLTERLPLYREIADREIVADECLPEEIAALLG